MHGSSVRSETLFHAVAVTVTGITEAIVSASICAAVNGLEEKNREIKRDMHWIYPTIAPDYFECLFPLAAHKMQMYNKNAGKSFIRILESISKECSV